MWLLLAAGLLAADPNVETLVAQLENRTCVFDDQPFRVCEVRPWAERWLGWLVLDHPRPRCLAGAARCLAKLGPRARSAVPALLKSLEESGDDFDTGDGIIGTRSAIAGALASIGDARAIPVMVNLLRQGAGRAEWEVLEALGRLGPAVGEDATAFVRDRLRRATDSYAASATARLLLVFEPRSEEARREVEKCAGSAALTTDARVACLGALTDARSVPVLMAALGSPSLARASAQSLERIGPPASAAIPALLAVVRLPSLVERQNERLVYSVEASARLDMRVAALRAIGAIDPGRAAAHAEQFVGDPDLGSVAGWLRRSR